MNGLSSVRGAGAAVLRLALLAAMLMLAAGTGQADPGGGRGSGRGERGHDRGGERGQSGGGERRFRGGGDQHGGGGGRTFWGGDRGFHGGGPAYGGSGHMYRGGGGPVYGGGSHSYGGGRCYSGARYFHGGGYRRPIGYRYARPRSYFSLGFGTGLPYYCPPTYRAYVEPYPIVREVVPQIDVENEPPAGCYYYDPFCDREFSTLDEYTDHIDTQDHAKTIEILRKDTGDFVRTLEFVGGYWSVRK